MKASVLDGARYSYSVENDGQDETHEKPAFIRVNSCPFVVELAYVWIRAGSMFNAYFSDFQIMSATVRPAGMKGRTCSA